MFLTSAYLALAVVIVVPLIVLPVLMLSRRLRKMSRRTQDALAEMSAMATETLGASRTVKSFVQETAAVERLCGQRRRLLPRRSHPPRRPRRA